jgi:hypothetical protein
MTTLAQHLRQSNNDSDDSKSNVSSVSSFRIAQACPCCKKEVQARVMFNHLRKIHPEFVKSMYCVWKDDQLDELIKTNAPFPIEWTTKDDFDDDVPITLWGCLGCNNTYTTIQNAIKHCNTTKCKKEHNVNLRKIKKEEQMDRENHQKKLSAERQRWLNRTPAQIYSCIQQDITYYTKKWIEVGSKVSRYLVAMKHDTPQDYIFICITSGEFEDDKKKMEALERQVDREITMWKRKYEDILPLLWGELTVVSHSDYESLEKMIKHTQCYEPKF